MIANRYKLSFSTDALLFLAFVGFGDSAKSLGSDLQEDSALPQDAQVENALPSATTSDADDFLDDSDLEAVDLLDLEVPVVVTATRREQSITSIPYAVSVITAADIRRSGARTIPDALRLAAGVDVADLSMIGQAVSPRGFHGWLSNYMLVLVDGRQIYDAFFGGTIWSAWGFHIDNIERIEVVRGAAGVVWGANAVNGVINIITKDPGDQLGVTGKVVGGSRGYHNGHVSYGMADEKLRLRLSVEYDGSDGFRKGGSFLRALDDGDWGSDAHLHAIYELDEFENFTVSAGSHVGEGMPISPIVGFGLRRKSDAQASYMMGKWSRVMDRSDQLSITAYFNDFHGSNGDPAVDYRYQQLALQLSRTQEPGEAHTLTWGFDTRLDLVDTTNSDPQLLSKDRVNTPIVGIYLQDDWRFSPRWTLSLAGRVDYDSYGGFQPSGRGAISFKIDKDSSIYGSVARAYHMPVAASRFLSLPLFNGLAHAIAEDDLDPTGLVSYELGYRTRSGNGLNTSVNLFWHEYSDIATFGMGLGPPGLVAVRFDNRADASLYGVECETRYVVTPRFSILGNYTFQQIDWRSSAPFRDTDRISPPRHKFMIGAHYSPTDDVHLSSHLYFTDSVDGPDPANPLHALEIDGYFRLDVRAEYEFCKDKAAVAIGVSNLLDSDHYEGSALFLNSAEVPRMVFAELRFSF